MKNKNRDFRQNIKKPFTLILICIYTNILQAQNYIPLPDTLSGNEINLIIRSGSHSLRSGTPTQTISYNGIYLGPTIILHQHQHVKFTVKNLLGENTSTHWHGMHVAPENDGSPHNPILPGSTWSPEFDVKDNASLYWYHPHIHGSTMTQVIKGAAGLIIVRDEHEAKLNLPRSYGIDDFPLVCQFQTLDANNQFVIDDEKDNTIMVNGTIDGILQIPAQVVRLRLLNASSHRVFRYGFSNAMDFYQIGSDGGLLNSPVKLNRLNLSPGERAEILLNLTGLSGSIIQLMTFGNELPLGYPGGPLMMNMPTGPLDNKTVKLLTLEVKSSTMNPVTTLPGVLADVKSWPTSGAASRTINLTAQPMMSSTNFFINGKKYDENYINFTSKQDEVEIWTITNQTMMAHPFHIHGNSFYLLSVNGAAPPADLLGKKDVVMVPPMNGSVRLITKYEDFSNAHIPYMYHCHILSHEDGGMMGQFIVNPTVTNARQFTDDNNLVQVFPNPLAGNLKLQVLSNSRILKLELYDVHGIKLIEMSPSVYQLELPIPSCGNYIIMKLNSENGTYFKKIILEK